MDFPAFHGWIDQHPDWALLAVFLVATAESLAVVGLLVPGVAMMFAAGGLVGTGALEFWPICAAAVAGAIVGDGLSFWLGWHYRGRVGELWPLNHHPDLIDRGITFFYRHGGPSVLFGRFVGPIRAVIPLVAGMLAMPPRRFFLVNVLSALLWGPAYLLPGMAFGASLDLASAVAGRLAVVLVALLALLWFAGWLGVRLYRSFWPRACGLILAIIELSRRHPLFGRLALLLPDPARRDHLGLLAGGLLLAGLAALWWIFGAAPGERIGPISASMAESVWLDDGWRRLPGARERALARAEHPLALQWAAPLGRIAATLSAAGWHAPPPLTPATALVFLKPNVALGDLPIPTHFFQSKPDALRLVRPAGDGRWLIVRFWLGGVVLEPGGVPLWLGAVSFLEARGVPGLWQYADETGDPDAAAQLFADELRRRQPVLTGRRGEGGTVLLIPPMPYH